MSPDVMFFFFFSSRRRHTRYWRDWSSDVCSSDLAARVEVVRGAEDRVVRVVHVAAHAVGPPRRRDELHRPLRAGAAVVLQPAERRLDHVDRGELARSEEHTSELQSRQYLVCRLLLEKKNIHELTY